MTPSLAWVEYLRLVPNPPGQRPGLQNEAFRIGNYRSGENGVGARKTDSTLLVSAPHFSVSALSAIQSGSARKPCHEAVAAGRLAWATMYTSMWPAPLSASSG